MYKPSTAGYSFIEVLVAIAILLISIVGPLTIASTGLRNAAFAREQNTAFFLAQEGIEGMVYLRENAGLEHFHNSSNGTWDWVDTLPNECFSGSACRIDIGAFAVSECNPESECDLYVHSSGAVRYTHSASGGESTPFRRELFFRSVGDALHVRSVVTWYASTFGAPREVELETYLYDIYEN